MQEHDYHHNILLHPSLQDARPQKCRHAPYRPQPLPARPCLALSITWCEHGGNASERVEHAAAWDVGEVWEQAHVSAVLGRHEDAAAEAGDQDAGVLGVPQQRALHCRQHHLRPARQLHRRECSSLKNFHLICKDAAPPEPGISCPAAHHLSRQFLGIGSGLFGTV